VVEETKQEEELRKKNVRLAIILALVAFGIYAGFLLKQL